MKRKQIERMGALVLSKAQLKLEKMKISF